MAGQDAHLHLTHMLENVERIRGWTKDLTIDGYRSNIMLRDAVERCLERVSEASRRLPEDLKSAQPQIPWRKVADIGDVLRHEYDDISDIEVWRIIADDLESLRTAIQIMTRMA